MMSIKKSNCIPLHIVDDHNDALQFILKGIGSKQLSFSNNLLIHFDSHPDLLLHEELEKEDVYNKEVLLEKISIETWILPLVFAQHVNEIVWIKPEWSKQIDNGVYTFYIGETNENRIKVSAPHLYFVGALIYAPFDELINPKKFNLHVVTWDVSEETVTRSQLQILELIKEHGEDYLLDIDLDFFYTLNPFLDMYSKANMYEQLKCIYSFSDKELRVSSPKEAQEKRKKLLDAMENIFNALEKGKSTEEINLNKIDEILNCKDEVMSSKVKYLINSLNDEYSNNIDWLMVHAAGTTVDDEERELPHHPSTDNEINIYINHLQTFLKGFPNPKLVSVARSSSDDYCPTNIAEQLQERVHKILSQSFNASLKIYNHIDE